MMPGFSSFLAQHPGEFTLSSGAREGRSEKLLSLTVPNEISSMVNLFKMQKLPEGIRMMYTLHLCILSLRYPMEVNLLKLSNLFHPGR